MSVVWLWARCEKRWQKGIFYSLLLGSDRYWQLFSVPSAPSRGRQYILTFPPKLFTWEIMVHLRLRVLKQIECWRRRRWPTLRGKLRLKLLRGAQFTRGRESVGVAPMKSAIDFHFEARVQGGNRGDMRWRHRIVSFPCKRRQLALHMHGNGSGRARFLRPVMWQWWRRRWW